MKSTTTCLLTLLICSTCVSSCWQRNKPINPIRPIKATRVEPLENYSREFIGRTRAATSSDLAFRVGGLIQELLITDGSMVKEGDMLCRLDPTDYLLQLSADKSSYSTALASLQRSERLLARQAISQQEYEINRAKFAQAKASYHYAQNQLSYTELKAPFSGSIEQTFVDDFQRVSAGERICRLINPNHLEVQFILPQKDIALSNLTKGYYIKFDNYPKDIFSAKITEVVDASVGGAGIPITLEITDKNFTPKKYNIKAGFPCRVLIKVQSELTQLHYTIIPLTSLFSPLDSPQSRAVWVYNPKTSTVDLRDVEFVGLYGNSSAIISKGLKEGEMVVTAGVYQIEQGERVTLE